MNHQQLKRIFLNEIKYQKIKPKEEKINSKVHLSNTPQLAIDFQYLLMILLFGSYRRGNSP